MINNSSIYFRENYKQYITWDYKVNLYSKTSQIMLSIFCE